MSNRMRQNGNTLREDYKERLVVEIKKYYMILRIFGTYLFAMTCLAMVMLVYNLLTNEDYRSGLFAYLPIRIIAFTLMLSFVGVLVFLTYQLMMISIRKVRAIKRNEFTWRMGRLTEKRNYRNSGARLRVDNELCIPLGMNICDLDSADIGDDFLVIYLGKKSNLLFAMDPYKNNYNI